MFTPKAGKNSLKQVSRFYFEEVATKDGTDGNFDLFAPALRPFTPPEQSTHQCTTRKSQQFSLTALPRRPLERVPAVMNFKSNKCAEGRRAPPGRSWRRGAPVDGALQPTGSCRIASDRDVFSAPENRRPHPRRRRPPLPPRPDPHLPPSPFTTPTVPK